MSSLKYYAYPGVGQENQKQFWYSQAVRVGDRIECAGQGGWNTESGELSSNRSDQIDQAFANVDLNLKDAGGRGWADVFSVRSYHTPAITDEDMEAMVRNLKKWCPDHQPIWTVLGVTNLGLRAMTVEIDIVAVDKST